MSVRYGWICQSIVSMIVCVSAMQIVRGEDISDQFDDAKTLKSWKVLKSPSGDDLYRNLDIGKGRKGWLTIAPKADLGWYNEGMGPMLYKEIEGDFLIETSVATHSSSSKDRAPQAIYNSAGLIVRDPASGPGKQNWVVVNIGHQDPDTGTEVKTTVNSQSELQLQKGPHAGKVRLARIGSTVYAARKLDGEQSWTVIRSFDRKDLPKKVQVGLMCNGWTPSADLVGEYDYIRFSVPKSEADLTVDRN